MNEELPQDQKVSPVSTGKPAADAKINAELALFNRTGNMIALWAAFGLCARLKVPLPKELITRIGKVADELLQHANGDAKLARVLVADTVLGTKKQAGGRSIFASYKLAKRNAKIVARIYTLMAQDLEDVQDNKKARRGSAKSKITLRTRITARSVGKAKTHLPSLPAADSQTQIYEKVAEEFEETVEIVKRLFEQEERFAGSFSFRVIREIRRADGVIDV